MYFDKVFHIGIPKSGTTTIQAILENDKDVALSRSTYFTTSSWWTSSEEPLRNDEVNIESNETLVTGGYSKAKLNEVFKRISTLHPNARIIVTIRQQEDAILSMFKYHIKHNFKGVNTLENWMYNTNLGMDYLSTCMYGNLAKLLMLYFKKENIHFLCFEDLKTQPDSFFNEFYNILGLTFKSKIKNPPQNINTLTKNQLYTLTKMNFLPFTKMNSEQSLTFKKIRSLEQKVKFSIIQLFKLKCPKLFFEIREVRGYKSLMQDYKDSNRLLVDLGFLEEMKLRMYNYSI